MSAGFVCFITNSKYAISLLSLLANKRIHMLQLDSGVSINFVKGAEGNVSAPSSIIANAHNE